MTYILDQSLVNFLVKPGHPNGQSVGLQDNTTGSMSSCSDSDYFCRGNCSVGEHNNTQTQDKSVHQDLFQPFYNFSTILYGSLSVERNGKHFKI